MSQENVETVQAAFAALASGGADALADYSADDIHYQVIAGAPGVHRPMLEKEVVRASVQNWSEVFDDFAAAPIEVIGARQVLAPAGVTAKAQGNLVVHLLGQAFPAALADRMVCQDARPDQPPLGAVVNLPTALVLSAAPSTSLTLHGSVASAAPALEPLGRSVDTEAVLATFMGI